MTERLEAPDASALVAEPEERFPNHIEQRTIVLAEQRVLYLPVPKAGWTTVGWILAEVAGLPSDLFEHSMLPGVSTSLTIHDMNLWGTGYRLADYEGEERERILTEEGWFRFSVVRNPSPRALVGLAVEAPPPRAALLRRCSGRSRGSRASPSSPRTWSRTSAALPPRWRPRDAVDVHWAIQSELLDRLPIEHVGRLEKLDETLALLREHVGGADWPTEQRQENRTPVPLPPAAYDEEAAAALNGHYAEDFERYGYEPVTPAADAAGMKTWSERMAPLLPIIKDTIDKHARIGQLHQVARRVQFLEERLENRSSRQVGHANSPILTNLENHTDFNVVWGWSEADTTPGFTAVVRAKNEADPLPWVLPPLLRAVERIVLVDNGSTDGTPEVARRVAEECGAAERLEVHSYPFSVARCGEEHLGTPPESVHSLVYFYNWSFSQVRTGYALKWDADMVLTDAAAGVLRDLAWQLEADQVVVKIPRYPLYVVDEQHAFLDVGMSNTEPWAWPNRPGYSFVKAMEWEQPLWPATLPTLVLPDWSCIELKRLDADEFSHWSHTDFGQSARTRRKRREWEVFNSLAHGAEAPDDVISVEAPEDVHVIEHVRSTVLPEMAAKRDDFGARLIRQLTA